jgi:hypothetical protein
VTRTSIDISGADGGGSSLKIYETPDYHYPWRGACVMHGAFRARVEPSPGVEVVELCLPGIEVRVRAEDVRAALAALQAADRAWRKADFPGQGSEEEEARRRAFEGLRAAVLGLAGKHITVGHLEVALRGAFEDGVRHGEELFRARLRGLLGL